MKTYYIVIVSVVAGLIWGGAISWAHFAHTPPLEIANVDDDVDIDQPRVSVDQRHHDFGHVEQGVKMHHAFHFTNMGKGTLTLEAGPTTCSKCTITQIDKTSLAPGESTDVNVEYTSGLAQKEIRQGAYVLTNDPRQPQIRLSIYGLVVSKYQVTPDTLVLSSVPVNESMTSEIKVVSYEAGDVHLVNYTLEQAESAPYFEIRSEPIPADQLNDPRGISGCRVLVTLKPGLPLGPIRQTIRLELAMSGLDQNPKLEVPVQGTIVSDISLVGAGWDRDQARLSFPTVKSAVGTSRKLMLLLHGEHRHDVQIGKITSDPAWIKVTAGEPSDLNASVTQIPLTIEIPPGQQPVNHLGFDQGKYAEVVVEIKDHEQIKEVPLHLRFMIEK